MGATKKCKYCLSDMPSKAKVCPTCRRKQKHTALGITLLIFGISFAGCEMIGMLGNNSSAIHSTTSEKTSYSQKQYVTIDDFNFIEPGMQYEDVVKNIGYEGSVMSESQVEDIITTLYYWYGENGISNISIIVQNGVVLSKSQVGLE